MPLTIDSQAVFIVDTLQKAKFQVYIVGGAVRDLVLKKSKVTDYDFATNALPEQILALFANSFYENQFGTVMVTREHIATQMGLNPEQTVGQTQTPHQPSTKIIDMARATKIHNSLLPQGTHSEDTTQESSTINIKNLRDKNHEITTFRSDGTYKDYRRPDQVTWGQDIYEDLKRRDFTINALALNITPPASEIYMSSAVTQLNDTQFTIIDPHQGLEALEAGIIKTVGDPLERFNEDALRTLRAIRFAVQLQMQIDSQTHAALKASASLIEHISWERIRDEFLKMLSSLEPKKAIVMLDETNILKHILPELLEAKGVEQAGHHTTDVWTHSLDALEACPSPDPIVRFATLLHDIAKPRTHRLTDGKPTFYNHEIVGSRMAKQIAARFRLSKKDQDRIFTLVRYHMFHYQPHNTDASIRRFMRKVGLHNLDDILDLREADRLGSGAKKTSWRLEEMKTRMIEQLNQPLDVTDLAINGHDLMKTFDLQPGPLLGHVLHQLFEWILEEPEHNNRPDLLQRAKALIADSI